MVKRQIDETSSIFHDHETHPERKKVCKDTGKQPEAPSLDLPLRLLSRPQSHADDEAPAVADPSDAVPNAATRLRALPFHYHHDRSRVTMVEVPEDGPFVVCNSLEQWYPGVNSWADLSPRDLHSNKKMYEACLQGVCDVHHPSAFTTRQGGLPGYHNDVDVEMEHGADGVLSDDLSSELSRSSQWDSHHSNDSVYNCLCVYGVEDECTHNFKPSKDPTMTEDVDAPAPNPTPEPVKLLFGVGGWEDDSDIDVDVEELQQELEEAERDRDRGGEESYRLRRSPRHFSACSGGLPQNI